MSTTRTYHLRARTDAGLATQPRVSARPVSPQAASTTATVTLNRNPAPQPVRSFVITDAVQPLYSDVAASRPPSPRREMAIPPVEPRDSGREHSQPQNVATVIHSNEDNLEKDSRTVSEENVPSPRQENTTWTTVRRRRARSLSSLENTQVPHRLVPPSTTVLTTEQRKAVHVQLQGISPINRNNSFLSAMRKWLLVGIVPCHRGVKVRLDQKIRPSILGNGEVLTLAMKVWM